ncbi:gephyrin-like molybdotransferase Glp [Thermodesulfobacteriota bacterium]
MPDRMLKYDDALAQCMENTRTLPRERVPLLDSLGRVLREDIRSSIDIPPFHRSAMDGYAVRWGDLRTASSASPRRLRVLRDLAAGSRTSRKVLKGEAIRIMTGAPLPAGADAVVMVEYTERDDPFVKIFRSVERGENIGPAGEDVAKGETILEKGVVIGPADMGMAAACGRKAIYVAKRPRIGFFSTGDEVAVPGTRRRAGQIFDANGYSLSGLAREAGAEPIFLGVVRDREEDLVGIFERTKGLDLIVLSGGVSVGDYDLVYKTMKATGVKELFWRVAIKPGKPIFVGRRSRQLLFGLPGYPVSAMVTFLLFVRPVIDRMLGKAVIGMQKGRARVLEERKLKPGRMKFLRASLESGPDGPGVRIIRNQHSGVLKSMVAGDVLVEVPGRTARLKKGRIADIHYMK